MFPNMLKRLMLPSFLLLLASCVCAQEKGDRVYEFRFAPRKDAFFVPYGENLAGLEGLSSFVAARKEAIENGRMPLVVEGGEVSVTAGSATDVTLPVTNLKAEGIVLPNTDTAGMLLTFTVPTPVDHTFTWAIKEAPKSRLFEAGKKYLYAITIAKTGVTVTSTVTDWVPGNGPEGKTGNAE